jgi:TPR repeat protein
MYAEGDGTKQDYFKSVKYYTKACDGNYALACYKLGVGHFGGYAGCSQSFPKAKNLFNKACKGGIHIACDKYA